VPHAAARRSLAAILQRTVPERRPGAVGRRALPGCWRSRTVSRQRPRSRIRLQRL